MSSVDDAAARLATEAFAWVETHQGNDGATSAVVAAPARAVEHPLSGERVDADTIDIATLDDVARLFDAVWRGLPRDDAATRFCALWRFLPDPAALGNIPSSFLGKTFAYVPAGPGLSAHGLWDLLGIASAVAGVLARGHTPALMFASIGPVQSFIAQARRTNDLWAGSHLLAAIAWEMARVVCEEVGPDALIFPALRGVALVDAWLEGGTAPGDGDAAPKHESPGGSLSGLFGGAPWKQRTTDANPLYVAALPNRIVAIVPWEHADALASKIETRIHEWSLRQATRAWQQIASLAEPKRSGVAHAQTQIRQQLQGFPSLHWAAVPWEQGSNVHAFLRKFYPADSAPAPLEGDTHAHLYAATYDWGTRAQAAAKATRAFHALAPQRGYRCSLCGEREWLAFDAGDLLCSRGHPGAGDPWPRVAEKKPGWARNGEHLCAVCTLKRLWPTLFTGWVGQVTANVKDVRQYVVSTRVMAQAHALDELAEALEDDAVRARLETRLRRVEEDVAHDASRSGNPALPLSLARRAPGNVSLVRQVVATLDALDDLLGSEASATQRQAVLRARRELEHTVERATGRPSERYYAVFLLDGDRMGQWISRTGDDPRRGPTPAYHAALSHTIGVLAAHIFPFIAQEHQLGRVIYAGGDDLMAMTPASALLDTFVALRQAFRGEAMPGGAARAGFVRVPRRRTSWLRAMGRKATCSVGAVVAHHTAPLASVLQAVRRAERAAKDAGRNAASVWVLKRSGGATRLTLPFEIETAPSDVPWRHPWNVVDRLRALIEEGPAQGGLGRRAAFHVAEALRRIEGPGSSLAKEAVETLVVRGFQRTLRDQAGKGDGAWRQAAHDLVEVGFAVASLASADVASPMQCVVDMVSLAEFLSRPPRRRPGGSARSEQP